MSKLLTESAFFGVAISLIGYQVGLLVKKRLRNAVFNPLIIAIIFVIIVIKALGVDYDSYYAGARYISYLLTPATVCLAIPLYQQLNLLRDNWKAIIIGVISGIITSLSGVFLFSLVFNFSHEHYVTLLPKSITTAIAMGVSEQLGGIVTITVVVVIITGLSGVVVAEPVLKLFRIHEPIAKGLAIGTSAHAVGTTKALELGEVEGAMSSLAITVAGLLTVIGASIFANFI